MKIIEIVPGKAIGAISLGALERELPSGASVADGVGNADGVHFSIVEGRVDDAWIDDLPTFPHDLLFRGRPIPRSPTLDQLKDVLGSCAPAGKVLGGIFYNCSGVTIGCDHENRPVQLRLKPR